MDTLLWLHGQEEGGGRKRQSFLQMTICGGTLVGRLGNNLNYCLACSSWNTSGPHLSQSTIRLVLPEEGGLFHFQIHLFSQQVCVMCILTLEMMKEKQMTDVSNNHLQLWEALAAPYFLKCGRKYEKIKQLKYFTFVDCGSQSQKMASLFSLGASLFTDDHCFFFCRSACLTRSQ